MKINTLLIGWSLFLISCANEPVETHIKEEEPIFEQACECLDLANVLQSELLKANSSDAQNEIHLKYQEQINACDKVIKAYSDGFTGLNEQEIKEREHKMGSICPKYKDIPK